MKRQSLSRLSAGICECSILLYVVWLLLPAVQAAGRAVTGAAAVALFGIGTALDWERLRRDWADLAIRALCAALMPLLLRRFLARGGANFAGFYVQQAMFWFPLVYAGYARRRGDRRLWRFLRMALLACVCVTVCTTIGWLIQGMLRGGRVYAYARSLGYGGEGRDAYLRELMLRNIGGYDFVYAMVISLPLTCLGIQRRKGRARVFLCALLTAQAVMIALSQYTYAMLFCAAILAVEGVAALIRRASRGRVGLGKSLLLGCVPLLLALGLLRPLAALGAGVCGRLGLSSFAHSFEQLLLALSGQAKLAADSRLAYYLEALRGFAASPLVGSLLGAPMRLSQHSEVLDLLSGMGLLGTAACCGLMWRMGRGLLRGARRSPYLGQLCVMYTALLSVALLGTVFYSRDICAVCALGTLLVLEDE